MPPLDLALFQALNADAATWPGVIAAARWVSQNMPWALGGMLAALAASGSAEQRRSLALALAALGLAWLQVQWLRAGVHVPRPAQLGIGTQWIEHGARTGFPSMHAATAFALAAGLALGRTHRWLAGLAWAAALAMGWSRVCLGVHFPSDVLAGALVGAVSACGVHAAAAAARRLSSPRRS